MKLNDGAPGGAARRLDEAEDVRAVDERDAVGGHLLHLRAAVEAGRPRRPVVAEAGLQAVAVALGVQAGGRGRTPGHRARALVGSRGGGQQNDGCPGRGGRGDEPRCATQGAEDGRREDHRPHRDAGPIAPGARPHIDQEHDADAHREEGDRAGEPQERRVARQARPADRQDIARLAGLVPPQSRGQERVEREDGQRQEADGEHDQEVLAQESRGVVGEEGDATAETGKRKRARRAPGRATGPGRWRGRRRPHRAPGSPTPGQGPPATRRGTRSAPPAPRARRTPPAPAGRTAWRPPPGGTAAPPRPGSSGAAGAWRPRRRAGRG